MNTEVGADHCRVVPIGDMQDQFGLFEFYRRLYAYCEAGLRIPPSSEVLEIGCGEGYGANYLSSRITGILAIDLSFQALNHARRRYSDIRFCRAVGTHLPFAPREFDAVLSFQVIEHIPEANAFASEIFRVLKPGGSLFLTTPNRKLRLLPFQRPWNPYHVREYSANQLSRFVKHWFDRVQVQGIMAPPFFMSLEKVRVKQDIARLVRRKVGSWLRKLPSTFTEETASPFATAVKDGMASKPIQLDDFFLSSDVDQCLDLFVVATTSGS